MTTPYVVYLTWTAFVSALPDRGVVRRQVVSTTRTGPVPTVQTALWLTTEADGRLHALRLPIEVADLLLPTADAQRERRRRMQQRATVARICVDVALPHGLDVAPGLLLVPGVYDDLTHIEGSADLWQWTGDPRDPDTRVLAPVPRLTDAVARYQRDWQDFFDDDKE